MSEVLRWGILSTATIATGKVIPGMRRAARTEISAIASRNEALARSWADRFGIPTAYGSYESLLADPDVDAVYIPLPNHLHKEWSIRAARAGKHVLCEKPLALTAADAEEMMAAAESSGVVLMEAFMYRHHPSWVAVRDIVASGRIGRVTTIQSWFSYYNNDATNIRNILDFGGGALYDIGCYCINLSRMLFGGEPVRVTSAISRDPSDGTDILTSAILEFDGGIASFTCSTRTEPDQRVHVYGDRGHISISIPFNIPPDRPTTISVTAGGDPPVAPATDLMTFETKDPYAAQAEAFARVVLDGAPPPIPRSDPVANLRVIEAIFEAAAKTGRS